MNELPIERQVCSLEQAKELKELLGEHAPESLWCWVHGRWGETNPQWRLVLGKPANPKTQFLHAYTGDELGELLLTCMDFDSNIPLRVTDKAKLMIKGLKEGWIKPEDLRYG